MPESVTTGAVLAFDFGTKRIGIAVGDWQVRMAHPLGEIAAEAGQTRFAAIERLMQEWQPQRLVVGLPLSPDGQEHETTRRAARFARQLEGRFGLPVSLVDERYTSVEAEAGLRRAGARNAIRNRRIDSAAAQLILQQYFDDRPA